MMNDIQRYDLLPVSYGGYTHGETMLRRDDGDWVTYDDHVAALASERQQIIREVVRPLMKCLAGQRDYCFFNGDTFVHPFYDAVVELLATTEAKLKDIQG